MPRDEYRSVSVHIDDMKKLDALPGNSRQSKIKQLIQDEYIRLATNQKAVADADSITDWVITQLPNWNTEDVWELIYKLLQWMRSPKSDDTYRDAANILIQLASGERPSDGDIILVAAEIGVEEEKLLALCDRLFGNGKKPNGTTH